jgi:hypothetical protein
MRYARVTPESHALRPFSPPAADEAGKTSVKFIFFDEKAGFAHISDHSFVKYPLARLAQNCYEAAWAWEVDSSAL